MTRLLLPLLLFLTPCTSARAQSMKDPLAYQLFRQGGKPVKYKKVLRAATDADVILFGESHNDAIAHWLQNVLFRDLHDHDDRPLVLGLEMLEADQQKAVFTYLMGELEAGQIDEVGSGLWPNWRTDYEPLVTFAKNNFLRVIATNVPRAYARMVFRGGLDTLTTLPANELAYLPPLPIPYDPELPGYRRMLEMMPGGHGGATFPMAQAIKDATMAWFIKENTPAGTRFFHLNGSYHSDDFEGIGWYLQRYAPELKVMTISTVEQANVRDLDPENAQKAHFILAVPALMTRTY